MDHDVVKIWDCDTGDRTRVIETDERLHYTEILPTNYIPAAAGTDLLLYRPDNEDRVRIPCGRSTFFTQRAPDGSWVVTFDEERPAHVWDLRTGEHLTVLSEHTKAIHTAVVAESHDLCVLTFQGLTCTH